MGAVPGVELRLLGLQALEAEVAVRAAREEGDENGDDDEKDEETAQPKDL
jgi:hypothetical protein